MFCHLHYVSLVTSQVQSGIASTSVLAAVREQTALVAPEAENVKDVDQGLMMRENSPAAEIERGGGVHPGVGPPASGLSAAPAAAGCETAFDGWPHHT